MTSLNTESTVATWNIRPGSRRGPLIIAHRGDASAAPENTLAAFRQSLAIGADGVELDVRLTRDGKLVVFHDRLLDRTSNGHGWVADRTLAELQSLDVGAWFGPAFKGEAPPTLDEVFETLPRDYLINVEMKVDINGMRLIAHLVAEAVRRHQRWDSTLVASFNPMALHHLRQMGPRIARGYIWSKHHPYPIRSRWLSWLARPDWLNPATDTYSAGLQLQGRPVLAWDSDFGGDMERMVAAHLDAVVTTDPAALIQRKQELAEQPDSTALR